MNQQLLDLYDLAEKENIDIDSVSFKTQSAMSLRTEDGQYHIAIDPVKLQGESDELCKLCHELGHCQTGSVYTVQGSSLDSRGRQEMRANRWAVHHLLPFERYRQALEAGYTNVWQLAEYFGVTEDFIRTAQYVYRCEYRTSI